MILVTGGNGKVGRRLTPRLEAMGQTVRVGSRSGSPAFDWEQPETWGAALAGVKACIVIYAPDLAVPGAPDTVRRFTEKATAAGVEHVVVLSGRGEENAQAAEEEVKRAAKAWTILRCSWFDQNFSEGVFLDAILGGHLSLPIGAMLEPFIDLDDVAEVAANALTDESYRGRTFDLTGPQLMTFEDTIKEISIATGREIGFSTVSMEEYEGWLRDANVPDDAIWLIRFLFTEVLDGRNASTTNDLEMTLGRPARTFAEYAATTAQTGIWGGRA